MGTITENTDAATHMSIKDGSDLMARRWMIATCNDMFRGFGETMSPTIASLDIVVNVPRRDSTSSCSNPWQW